MVRSTYKLARAHGQLVEERIQEGFEPTLLTFMFNPLPGTGGAKRAAMVGEIERTYHMLLTRIWRDPHKMSRGVHWPIWIVTPDLPVFKREKITLRDATVNGGLHYHAVALTPFWGRLRHSLTDEITERQAHFSGRDKLLFRLDAEPITHDPGYVVGYAQKAIARRWFDSDDILILPRSASEHTKLTKTERAYEREQALQSRKRKSVDIFADIR